MQYLEVFVLWASEIENLIPSYGNEYGNGSWARSGRHMSKYSGSRLQESRLKETYGY